MKAIFLSLIMLFSAAQVFAQTDEERTEMAKSLLDRMSKKNKSYSSIDAKFTLNVDNKQSQKKLDYKGTLTVKGDRYVCDLMGTKTFFDGTYTYSYVKEAKEVTIQEPDTTEEVAVSPTKLFSAYETGYKMRYIEDQKIGNADCGVVDLYPTDRNSNFSRIRLTIDKASLQIKNIVKQCKDGVDYNISVESFKTNRNISDDEFVFKTKDYPNVEVIDMRD